MFLGLVTSFPLRALLHQIFFENPNISYCSPLGFGLVALGFLLWRYTRKRYWVEGQTLVVADGLFRRPLRFSWQEEPRIRLRSQEEERGAAVLEFWLVNLVDGKRQYVLDRREGHQIESRSLAEALAKTINCPVLEKGESGEITIPREDLDLPFRERVRRNPDLLGPEVEKPDPCPICAQDDESGQRYLWRLMSPAMVNEFFTMVCFLALLAVVPIFPRYVPGEEVPERFALSFFHLARDSGQFLYFWVAGTMVALGAFVLFGYSKELRVTKNALHAQDRLWGVPCWSATIPAEQLEEIWVRQ